MKIWVAGGGLSGCEAAWHLAQWGHDVTLYEMRPLKNTLAHQTSLLGELVCSNSLGADGETVGGLLKEELRRCGSLIMAAADAHPVPAGRALAVDRLAFATHIDVQVRSKVQVVEKELTSLPEGPGILATGPMTSEGLARHLADRVGCDHLSFFDAVAPVIDDASIDKSKLYLKDRHVPFEGQADYLNIPLDKEGYERFVAELVAAERVVHDFEKGDFFEGCMPIEVMAARGVDSLRFGPLRPVGLELPDGSRPYAVAQLRRETVDGESWNLVGFQTNLKWGEQSRVFGLLPGLEKARFHRYGVMHRNIFLNAPKTLSELRLAENLWVAGQLTGVEGYLESTAMGLVAAQKLQAQHLGFEATWPEETAIGSLLAHLRRQVKNFQPQNVNRGVFPPLEGRYKRRDRPAKDAALLARAREAFEAHVAGWLAELSTQA